MAQTINTNIASLTAQRNLNKSQGSLATAMERLSSGLRINSAKDDAAGLSISERMTSQIRGLNQAVRNANDGISFAQTAEGALSTAGDAMQRIRELAVQAANDTNSASDRSAINNEVQQLIGEVNRIANATQFNGQNILDGSASTLSFQVGANQNQTISVSGVDAQASQLGARIATSGSIAESDVAGITDLVINGVTASTDSATTIDEVISAVNAVSSKSGVEAMKATTVDSGEILTADITTGDVTINSVSVTLDSTDLSASADAINALTNQTGVTATASGTGITLTNSDGSDIVVADGATGSLGGNETFHAGVTFAGKVADGAFSITGTMQDVATDDPTDLTQTDKTLNAVDVLSGANATDALLTLDFALAQVSGLRSELGAVQTRFESTISNLSVTSENLSAARSRIRDADFAAETAAMTRSQILQQAGTAMVSQANSLPQNVLSLLQ